MGGQHQGDAKKLIVFRCQLSMPRRKVTKVTNWEVSSAKNHLNKSRLNTMKLIKYHPPKKSSNSEHQKEDIADIEYSGI